MPPWIELWGAKEGKKAILRCKEGGGGGTRGRVYRRVCRLARNGKWKQVPAPHTGIAVRRSLATCLWTARPVWTENHETSPTSVSTTCCAPDCFDIFFLHSSHVRSPPTLIFSISFGKLTPPFPPPPPPYHLPYITTSLSSLSDSPLRIPPCHPRVPLHSSYTLHPFHFPPFLSGEIPGRANRFEGAPLTELPWGGGEGVRFPRADDAFPQAEKLGFCFCQVFPSQAHGHDCWAVCKRESREGGKRGRGRRQISEQLGGIYLLP